MLNEIKLTGLEALVLEELEKHLILNSNRLRTLKDARLEIVPNEEAKFGLRIRDSKPSGTGLREHSDPMEVGAVNSLSRQAGTRCCPSQPKIPNQIKMKTTKKNGETRCVPTYRNGCKNSEKILRMTVFLNTETPTRVLLMNYL